MAAKPKLTGIVYIDPETGEARSPTADELKSQFYTQNAPAEGTSDVDPFIAAAAGSSDQKMVEMAAAYTKARAEASASGQAEKNRRSMGIAVKDYYGKMTPGETMTSEDKWREIFGKKQPSLPFDADKALTTRLLRGPTSIGTVTGMTEVDRQGNAFLPPLSSLEQSNMQSGITRMLAADIVRGGTPPSGIYDNRGRWAGGSGRASVLPANNRLSPPPTLAPSPMSRTSAMLPPLSGTSSPQAPSPWTAVSPPQSQFANPFEFDAENKTFRPRYF